jgi:hypothetical protein
LITVEKQALGVPKIGSAMAGQECEECARLRAEVGELGGQISNLRADNSNLKLSNEMIRSQNAELKRDS